MYDGLNYNKFRIQSENQNEKAKKNPPTGVILAALRQRSMLQVMKRGINKKLAEKNLKQDRAKD